MLFRQASWRFCSRCNGYFHGPGSGGVCAAGGAHDPGRSGAYVTMNQDMSGSHPVDTSGLEGGWAFCRSCHLLFRRGDAAQACPIGGRHDPTGSGNYWVGLEAGPGTQTGWARCTACAVMFFAGDGWQGNCPATRATHLADPAHDYGMLFSGPLDEPGDAELLVIAPPDLAGAVTPLIDHRNRTGTPARLVTLDDVYGHYRGEDEAATVKAAITYAHQYRNTRFVLLVGDPAVMPVRYRHISWSASPDLYWRTGTYAPTDLYYANLYSDHRLSPPGIVAHGAESSWDLDGDDFYDEQRGADMTLPANNPDRVDGYVDVAVGRLPSHKTVEIERYVSKVIAFETHPRGWRIAASVIGDGRYADVIPDVEILSAQAGFDNHVVWPEVDRVGFDFSEAQLGVDGFRSPGAGDSVADIVMRSAWVVYLGHGSPGGWDVEGGDFDAVAALPESLNVPVVVGIGCQTGQMASFAPDGPGAYVDVHGVAHLYVTLPAGVTDPALVQIADYGRNDPASGAPPVREWSLATHGPLTAETPCPLQPDCPTVANAWLHSDAGAGAVAYIGEQTVAPDDSGAQFVGRMLSGATHVAAGTSRLGDLWLAGCRSYWIAFRHDPDWIRNARIYLSYMTLYGDPALRL